MKKWFICLSLVLVLAATAACTGQQSPSQSSDTRFDIIATINGEDVYRYEYDFYFDMFFYEFFTNSYESMRQLQGVDMLNEESSLGMLSTFEKYSWNAVQEATLVRQMVMQDYGVTLEPTYLEELLSPGFISNANTSRYYSELFTLLEAEAQLAKTVTEEDARAAYDANPAAWDSRQVAHIIISTQELDEAGKAEAKAKAEDILAQLDTGASFEDLAKEHSEDGSAAAGGLLGLYFNASGGGVSDSSTSFDPAFAAAAFTLQEVGDYSSELVESSFGYHIIKLIDRTDDFESVKAYVLQSMQEVTDQEVSDFLDQKIEERKAVATIERKFEFKYYSGTEEALEGEAEEQPVE